MINKEMIIAKDIMSDAVKGIIMGFDSISGFGDIAGLAADILQGDVEKLEVFTAHCDGSLIVTWKKALQDKENVLHDEAVQAFVLALLEGAASVCVEYAVEGLEENLRSECDYKGTDAVLQQYKNQEVVKNEN